MLRRLNLVPFDAEVEYNKRFDDSGFVGHRAGLEWFCQVHLQSAKKLKHLTKASALHQMSLPVYLHEAEVAVNETSAIILYSLINKHWKDIMALFFTDEKVLKAIPSINKNKTWTPMDNCVPPNCPYVVDAQNILENGSLLIVNRYSIGYWSDEDISNSLFSFCIFNENKIVFEINAYSKGNSAIGKVKLVSNTLTSAEFKSKWGQVAFLTGTLVKYIRQ